MAYRSSTGDLGFYDEPRRPERWDRDKFERYSRRAPEEREVFRFREHDHPGHREIAVEDRVDRRGPKGRVEERDRYYEEDRYTPPSRRRTELWEEPTPSEVASKALAPYRRKSVVERDIEVRRPARPQYIRRQSSLDTFDRRPLPRYGADDWRPPANVPIPLPIRRPSPPRRRSPSRRRYREEEFEEIRFRDLEPDREEEYRDIRIRRERNSRRRSGSHYGAASTRSSSSSFEEVSPVRESGKKGKTRMPKRLVHKSAIIQLGYPFEEEEDFFIVRRALGKEQIDEIIKISETYKESNNKTIYRYEEKVVEAPVPPPMEAPPPPPVMVQTTTEIVQPPPPPPPPMAYYPPPQSVRASSPSRSSVHESVHESAHEGRRTRSRAPSVNVFDYEEKREEQSAHIGGPLTIVLPERGRGRTDRDVKAEIRALEAERRAIKLEREAEEKRRQAERLRDSEYEIVESSRDRDVVRIEKDRKGRSRSKPPNPKLVALAMSTLT